MLKKLIYILVIIFFVSACKTSSYSVNSLQLGMSKSEVDQMFGQPVRFVMMSDKDGDYVSAYEYRIRSGLYELEFVNDRLSTVVLLSDNYSSPSPVYYPTPQPVYVYPAHPGNRPRYDQVRPRDPAPSNSNSTGRGQGNTPQNSTRPTPNNSGRGSNTETRSETPRTSTTNTNGTTRDSAPTRTSTNSDTRESTRDSSTNSRGR